MPGDITAEEAYAVFIDILDEQGVHVVAVDHEQYIAEAREHPFIAAQIQAGIYNDAAFGEEFMGWARTHAQDRRVEIDFDLMESHMKGVPRDLALGYCALVARHEYHHIEAHPEPTASLPDTLAREIECETYLREHHLDLVALGEQAEAASKTIQKVYQRMTVRS